MKGNGERRPDEILADIDRTRSDIDDTLHAIERRLTPGQLIDQGLEYLRNSGAREFASNLGHSVRDNPLPVALVGIGVAWLMATTRSDTRHPGNGIARGDVGADLGLRTDDGANEAMDGLGDAKNRVAQTARAAKERVGATMDRAADAVRSTRDRISDAAQTARERADGMREAARDQVDRARGGYDRIVREQPLALGAVGLALGAVVAAAAPRTREEDRLMGSARDSLADEAVDIARAQIDRARPDADAAEGAVHEAQEDQRHGHHGDQHDQVAGSRGLMGQPATPPVGSEPR